MENYKNLKNNNLFISILFDKTKFGLNFNCKNFYIYQNI